MIQIAPPQGRFITREKAKNPNSLKLVALIVLSLFSSVSYTAPIISTDGGVLSLKGFAENNSTAQIQPLNDLLNSSLVHNYSGLEIDYYSPMFQSQFTVNLVNRELNVNGETSASLYGTKFIDYNGSGNHLFYLDGSTLKFSGDVVAKIEQPDGPEEVGANLLYANKGSYAEVGKTDSVVRMWTIARSPDLISAKNGSKVKFKSTKNQLLGTIDLMDSEAINSKVNSVEIVFSGADAYWFGDEKTYMNTDYKFQQNYDDWLSTEADNFTLTFNNQAQWSYLGIQVKKAGYYNIPKRISSIELNGGIINLYDADVERYWKELGIWDLIQNEAFDMNVEGKHDYVRIGHLKGNGGIFRLDLNGDDKTQSDMVYIESGEGTHYFEPYNLQLLESITPENTLTFALVAKKDSSVQFKDKQNIHGQALVDYELEIAKKEGITEADLDNPDNAYWDKTANIDAANADQAELARKIDMNEFLNGTNWFIRRVTLKESAAAIGMTGAGYASYDAAIEMDRRDRRLAEQVRDIENSDNGLWVRVHHGRSGAENQYRWDRTGATVGIDRQITSNNRLGAYFTYTQGDTEFLDVRGDGDMKRYELAVFDTLQLGQHYFDFVGRLGRVSSDFNVGNQSYSTSGDFDQDYAAVSAEYGYQLLDTNGVFIEPQLQVQVAYVDGYDYDSQRGMQVDVDGEASVIGRAGLRAGREITTSSSNGSFYARADVYHQFTDGQEAVFSDQQGHRLDVNWGDTDTWASFGVGTSWVWKNRLGLQLDVEKVAGGKTEDTWLMSGRFSYLF